MNLLYTAILILSCASIAYEIILIRLLDIIQFSDLSSVVISLALFGFGLSGVFCSFLRKASHDYFVSWFVFINSLLFLVFVPISFMMVQFFPFNSLEMIWDFSKVDYLIRYFLCLSLPFFFVSNSIIMTLSYWKKTLHKVYFFDLLGAGLGASVGIVILWLFPIEKVLLVVSLVVFFGSVLVARHFRIRRGWVIAVCVMFIVTSLTHTIKLEMSPYKSLSKTLLLPESYVISEDSTPEAHIALVESQKIPFRFVPGLSFLYKGKIPRQLGVFIDGSSFFTVDQIASREVDGVYDYHQHVMSYLPYYIQKDSLIDVLQIGLTGINRMSLARKNKLQSLVVVEPNLALVNLLKKPIFFPYVQDVLEDSKIDIRVENGRRYLTNTVKKFSVIDLSLTNFSSDQSSASILGSYRELYSVEAFVNYKRALKEEGVLAISLWALAPPANTARLWNILNKASFSSQHMIILKSLLTTLVLAKKKSFNQRELEQIKLFCEERSFSVLYPTNLDQKNASHSNLDPFVSQKKELSNFLVGPIYDDKPFFSHQMTFPNFLLWFVGEKENTFSSFIESNYFHLWSAFLISIVLCFIFILFPLITHRLVVKRSENPGMLFTLYFALLGLGFMFTEITLINLLRQFFSYKAYSIAIVLTVFLVFAGIGSFFSSQWLNKMKGKVLYLFVAIGLMAFCLMFVCQQYSGFIYTLSQPLSLLLFLSLLAPLAFFMGMPFVLGIRLSHSQKEFFISWAWGINGFFSVVGAIAAKLLNIHIGFSWTMFVSLCLYMVAGFVLYCLIKKKTANS